MCRDANKTERSNQEHKHNECTNESIHQAKTTNKITNSAFFQEAVCHAETLDAQEAFAVSKGLDAREAFAAEQQDAEHLDACSHAADAAERATDVKDEPADQHAFDLPPAKAARAG
jgi:hypothetical protein